MKLFRLATVIVMCLFASTAARATILSAGSPLTFNVDFSAYVPYKYIDIEEMWTPSLVNTQLFTTTVFDDFNAQGTSTFASIGNTGTSSGLVMQNPITGDGIFSFQLSLNFGSVDVTSLIVKAGNGSDGVITDVFVATTLIPTTSVPEPATLALLGLGIAGLKFARRRRLI